MASQTFTGKTLVGKASLGATRFVTDVELKVTAITSPRVRQGLSLDDATKLGFAGSYGLAWVDGAGTSVVRWYPIQWSHQDQAEPQTIPCTHVFWAFRLGVTADLIVSY